MKTNTSCYHKSTMIKGHQSVFPCLQICVRVSSDQNFIGIKLLLQSDTKIYGDDYRRKPCSYLPKNCDNDVEKLTQEVLEYAHQWKNSSNPCYDVISDHFEGIAISTKQSDSQFILIAFILPFCGIFCSLLFCFEFWRRNYKHVSRLYVYNSWSAS